VLRIRPLDLELGPAPADLATFAREVEVVVEADDDFRRYAASFLVEVCSPHWLADRAASAGWTWGRRRLILGTWDEARITEAITSLVHESGETEWLGLMRHVAQYLQADELPAA
jgi:hypothetical protein